MSSNKVLFYGAFILFSGLLIFQIWDDVSLIIKLHTTIYTKDFGEVPAIISEDPSLYKPYGVVFLKLMILAVTLAFMFRQNKSSFIVLNSILIPFLSGLFFIITRNKFEGYNLEITQLLLIGSIVIIYLVLTFSPFEGIKKITLNIKDLCLIIFGILVAIISYLVVFFKM
jgi:hypothetical protein